MIFGGLEALSLIDYPGKMSCVVFTVGCNFRCPYCHNPDLVNWNRLSAPVLPEQRIVRFLEKRRGFLDGVVISGGEPTIQADLHSFCERIHQMGYAVKLDTNGSMPWAVEKLIKRGLVDYIAMDIKTDPYCYPPMIAGNLDPDSIPSSVQLIMESSLPYEFRTTCIEPFVDTATIERISELIDGAMLYVLQEFRSTGVLDPDFFHGADQPNGKLDLPHLKRIAERRVRKCIIR